MRRPVAAVEARRSRSPNVADDVAVMEGWVGKEGVPNPWLVPSEEAYAGSHPYYRIRQAGLMEGLGAVPCNEIPGIVQRTPVGALWLKFW
jgi:hypothetical protein